MPLKLLFVPVSSNKGIGEYMRSLSLAKAVADEQPDADIAFVLSRQAPYHQDCPFRTFLCPDSATRHSALVTRYIDEFNPQAVIFDASGRVAQLRFCQQRQIATIFICQHPQKLHKGLSWRRLRYTDAIWVVQPAFAIERLSLWSSLKLTLLGKPAPVAIGPIFQPPRPSRQRQILNDYGLTQRNFVLLNAGSGGHRQGEGYCAEIFAEAATTLASALDCPLVMVYGPNFNGQIRENAGFLAIKQLDAEDFGALLSQAKLAIIAGGSALYQAIHYGTASVSCAVSKDQHQRIQTCAQQGLTTASALTVDSLCRSALDRLHAPTPTDTTAVPNGIHQALHQLKHQLHHTR